MKQSVEVIWFTGLSGSGKTTLATALKQHLETNYKVYLLDGDVLRSGLNSDLGFSITDRTENIRRAAHIAKLLLNEGYTVIASFITPMNAQQALARSILSDYPFTEVYLSTPLSVCQQRDPKQLYARHNTQADSQMTGIGSPYQAPIAPELSIDTEHLSVEQSLEQILQTISD